MIKTSVRALSSKESVNYVKHITLYAKCIKNMASLMSIKYTRKYTENYQSLEWASYIEQFVEVQEELLIVGDFNIHVDSSNNESQSFLDILNANGQLNDVKLLMCNRRKPQKNIDHLINNYNSTLKKLTDKYAPLQCNTIPLLPHAPWYTSALRHEKRVRRRSERVAARTMLEVDRQIVQDMYRRRNEQLVEAKTSYFTKKVEESKANPKALFRLTRNMMGNSGDTILPLHTSKRYMANDFSAFFYNKILTIRSELGLPGLYKCGSMTTSFSGTPLTTFMDATEVEIRNIIELSPAKSCELDPLPTWLLKECIPELVPTVTDIVNMSLRDSLMPKSFKTALIRPLLKKKTDLDSDIFIAPYLI